MVTQVTVWQVCKDASNEKKSLAYRIAIPRHTHQGVLDIPLHDIRKPSTHQSDGLQDQPISDDIHS